MGGLAQAVVQKSGAEAIAKQTATSFFDFKVKDIEGNLIDFSQYKGKKAILVVNVACKCGLTSSNYTSLTVMHNQLKNRGFQLLGFPCNQFFSQESGTAQEIIQFVKSKFDSKFTLFEKVEVNGPNTHPVYQFLRNNSQLYNQKTKEAKVIPWNFAKFLLNEKGQVVKYFEPGADLGEVRKAIQRLL